MIKVGSKVKIKDSIFNHSIHKFIGEVFEVTYVSNDSIRVNINGIEWSIFKGEFEEYSEDTISPEQFIKNFKRDWDEAYLENVFTNGNCYHFALILKQVFDGVIAYDVIKGHFIVYIGREFYDITGIVDKKTTGAYYIWDELKNIDPLQYERILSDCVYKIKNRN